MPGQTSNSAESSETRNAFNGGPGNCPARRGPRVAAYPHMATVPSMEGRAIARPDKSWSAFLQWRAGQLPGQTWVCDRAGSAYRLQWRAGQLPGQTCDHRRSPLQWRAGQLPGQTSDGAPGQTRPSAVIRLCSFNGGPGNCPARLYLPPVRPSMEGRAIARPDRPGRRRRRLGISGPSMEGRAIARPDLQWRAGQLPGQTRGCRGRAGQLQTLPVQCGHSGPHGPVRDAPTRQVLQWRAGQLPGQTPNTGLANDAPSGGPANRDTLWSGSNESLQWRAGQLPGQTLSMPNPLQWRAGQLPGQTAKPTSYQRVLPFNGGPGNCPARPVPQRSSADAVGGPGNCPARRPDYPKPAD